MVLTITTLRHAVYHFTKVVCNHKEVVGNGSGGYFERVMVKDPDWRSHYIFFKRDWFNSFAHTCDLPEFEGEKGQTISRRALNAAVADRATIVIVMASGETYTLAANKWVSFNNQYPTTVREAKNSKGDVEHSVPKSLLVQVYPRLDKTLSTFVQKRLV